MHEKTYAEAPTYRQGYVSSLGTKVLYSKEWVKHHALEGDGLQPLLYMHLWKKNKGSESRLRNVRLPDTVVYEHNFPRAWYTYDGEAREINKHPGKMLDAQTIFEHFSKASERCDIVAQFLTTCVRDKPSTVNEDEWLSYSIFFTAQTLREFLFGHDRKPDGILQKFVVPKGNTTMRRNAQLQVMWSPLVTVVYKKTNRQRLGDTNLPPHVRGATFEGDYNLSEMSLVADDSKGRLEALCREVVDHIYFTDRKLIIRMVLNFKMDDANRFWLLWCGSLRVSADSLNPRNLRVPVALFMPTEIINDDSTTQQRNNKRQERQKLLLMLDRELFELSRDYNFGYSCNAGHVREARRIGLEPVSDGDRDSFGQNGPADPLRESMRYFGFDGIASSEGEGVARHGASLAAQDEQDKPQKSKTVLPQQDLKIADDIDERVRSELVAMALDAWYKVYSITLSEEPERVPTQKVVIAEPLMVVLHSSELDRLLGILGLERNSLSNNPREFRVKEGLIGPVRRFDRPLINAERDVREFFDEIFSLRGVEITQKCIDNDKWIW